jgi:O-antigen/teichoic acid export membrane protein
MSSLKEWFNGLLASRSLRQVLLLFGSYLGLIVLGFALKYEQTHILNEIEYGRYALVISIAGLLALIFHFGYFVSLQVLLAQNVNRLREKRILAAGFLMALICGTLLALSMWLFAGPLANFFHEDIAGLLTVLAPLFLILPFNNLLNAYGSGSNKLWVNMLVNLIPKALFLLTLLIWEFYDGPLGVEILLAMNMGSTMLTLFALVFILRPDFHDFKRSLTLLHWKNKKFGIQYYSGSIANQTTYKLDEICIGYFVNAGALGIYSLANMVVSPMLLMSQSLSSSMFKRFSGMKRIPSQIFVYNSIWLLGCVLFFFFTGSYITSLLFSADFMEVALYLVPISLVLLVHGSISPFSFLAAKSMGKEIRNIAWVEAVLNLSGNLILIPMHGIYGAILASFIAKAVNLGMMVFYYRRYLERG